jgi:WD40 repeat protein
VLLAPGLTTPGRAHGCPYRGLAAFRREDGDVFCGREEIVASMLERLTESGFLAVVGASGSGKSSLARAGVGPAFQRVRSGVVAVITPGADPNGSLERALAAGTPALLVVDQLEELFTFSSDEAGRDAFVDALVDLWESGSTAVLVTLRSDFYGRCANHPRLAAAVAWHQHLLGPMGVGELRRVIEGPARFAGLRFEAGLVDTMLKDVEDEPGALPLLSHALYETWARRDGRVLTFAGYRDAGGVQGAISHTAEEVFARCDERERRLVREMFLRLTELGEATEDTRRRVSLPELVPDGDDGPDASALVERLAGARLLVVDDDTAEIAHEALIREWPRLREWLTEDREQLRTLRQLTIAARAWEENGRDDADLYRGTRLGMAAEQTPDARPLSRLEREFVEASRKAQDRELLGAKRRANRLRALLVVVGAALVAAVVAGAFALAQRGTARHTATLAQAGRLAAQSREAGEQHPDLALLLALEAQRLDDSVDTRGALLGALEHGSRIRAWLQGFPSNVNASAFSPDGELLATLTAEETTLWDTATWRPVGAPLRSERGADGLAFSPAGRTLAIAGGAGHVELWDVASRRRLRRLADPGAVAGQEGLSAIAFSPDGAIVAAGGLDTNHVTLWNIESGRVLGRPIVAHAPGSGTQSIDFSPDSRRIALASDPGTVGIWDVATGRRIGRLDVGDAAVEEAIYADHGRVLIASDDSGAVSFLDVDTGTPIRAPLSVGDTPAVSLALSGDERLVAVASFDGSVHVWDVQSGVRYGAPLKAGTSPASDVDFSPDGTMLVSAHIDSTVIWTMTGERAIGRPISAEADLVTDVAFDPEGAWLLAGRLGGDAIVVDVGTGRRTRRFAVGSVVTSVAVHPGGNLVAIATIDGRVRLYDGRSGAAVGAPLGTRGHAIWQVAFSPDGTLLAAAVDPNGVEAAEAQRRDGEVRVWDVATRRRAGRAIRPGAGSVLALAFDPQGTRLATGSYAGQLDLWDVATRARTGTPLRVRDDGFVGVAFDSTGTLVAGGTALGPVQAWRLADRRRAFPPLSGHQSLVTGVGFDSRGTLLATTELFGSTRLWDPAGGLPIGDALISERPASLEPDVPLPFLGLRNAFSPDGRLLATAGIDVHAMLWDVDPAVWRQRACAIAGRNLSHEEWRLYLPGGTPYRTTCAEWPDG